MSSEFGALLLGFGLSGTFYAALNWASFKSLTYEIVRLRQLVDRAEATMLRMESVSKRKKDDADFWKYSAEEDGEED